jgi:hypothetical protein
MVAVIRKEAWSFHTTISGVHLCWELEEPKGPRMGSLSGTARRPPQRHDHAGGRGERVPLENGGGAFAVPVPKHGTTDREGPQLWICQLNAQGQVNYLEFSRA